METKSITTLVKVNINEVTDGGLDSTVLSISTTPAHPNSYVLDFMGVMTVVSRKNLEEAIATINKAATTLEV